MSERLLSHTWPALIIALLSVIAGGLLSAITAHAPTQSASWASAFLVLVGGVGTGGLAVGRGLLSSSQPSTRRVWGELITWVVGNGLVLAGTLLSPAWLVEVGSILLVGALGSLIAGVHRGAGNRLARGMFMTLVIVLLVSIPVGVLLSHLRR